MVQAADSRHGNEPVTYLSALCRFTTRRSSLCQCKVCSVVVVIADVLVHQAFQVRFVEHDDVVKQIPAAVANPALRNPVLPRTMRAGSLWLDAEVLHRMDDPIIESWVVIEDQVTGTRIVRECFPQLVRDPSAAGMLRHVVVENPPPVVRYDKEAVKHAEGQRWHFSLRRRRGGGIQWGAASAG